jgi:alpha-N-arabinofuranosidase
MAHRRGRTWTISSCGLFENIANAMSGIFHLCAPSVLLTAAALLIAHGESTVASAADTAQVTLNIDLDKTQARVSPTLYGLMTEEINHSYDGGLYAELVQNRTLKNDFKEPVHWSSVPDNAGPDVISLDADQPINEALPVCLRLDASRATSHQRMGVANDGYWGIPVRPGTIYRASFYAKTTAPAGTLTVSLESSDGAHVFAMGRVSQVTAKWKRYEVYLTAEDGFTPSEDNRLVVATTVPGTYWFNLVSLFPPTYHNRPNGNRVDLMELMAAMKPAFLRLPGGNYLEGGTIHERYPWQQTLGEIATRPGHPSCWGYRSSDGMGLLEFLEWCEDLKMQPVLAVYAGYSLRRDHVPAGPDLQPYVQEALEEIEYVTGGMDTKWGAERAKDGHPAPFPLTYVEIGNEDQFDKSNSYDGRFAQFYDAIKAKNSQLQLIATTKVTSRKPDLVDDHYYRDAVQMEDDAGHYDQQDRNGPKILVGEWATREGEPTTNMNAALGDAAWMTGMERNSDLVVMASYAPLFVNVNPGGMEWKSD